MDKNQLERLISQEEGSNLDYKSEIDLDTKRGKADFLVEVLGLANSPEKPAYLVLGVEDKTKKAVGISEEITEERIQKLIADNCRPPIRCVFEHESYKGKRIGVLIILGTKRPFILKRDHGFSDERGKQHTYTDKQVFVRRGSAGDTATTDEVVEMVLEHQTDTAGDYINYEEELNEISSKLYHIDNSINRQVDNNRRERAVEYFFVGITSGIVIGIFQMLGLGWQIATFGILLSAFWVSIFGSVLKIIRFGWVRSVIVSAAISAVFIALSFLFDGKAIEFIALANSPIYLVAVWSGVKGMVGGAVMTYLGRGEYEYD